MSLQNLLDLSVNGNQMKQGMSEERLAAQVDNLRELIAFYRVYPDIFVDTLTGYKDWVMNPDPKKERWKGFQFYSYQRIFLRIVMRHRYVYATFPRAYSKSFLTMMVLMLRCVLYPNSHMFVTTGGKERKACSALA